jgi:hypothetical protein
MSEREVAKWKRKGSIASDRAQKLERSYELQVFTHLCIFRIGCPKQRNIIALVIEEKE